MATATITGDMTAMKECFALANRAAIWLAVTSGDFGEDDLAAFPLPTFMNTTEVFELWLMGWDIGSEVLPDGTRRFFDTSEKELDY